MNLSNKENRLKLKEYSINHLLEKGYSQQTYKKLDIFTKDENGKFYLQCFEGTASKPFINYYYTQAERREAKIQECKKSLDRRNEYKAERKAKEGFLTGSAACAHAIKEELKKVFPDVKFSVRSENFSGGDAVRISWTDGPTSEMVENITSKYQKGRFNAMEDIYEYNHDRGNLPGAKYITESRHMSDEAKLILTPFAENIFKNDSFNSHNHENLLYKIFSKCSIPVGAKILGIERTEATSGCASDAHVFYRIVLELPEKKESKQIEKAEVIPGKVQIIEYGEKAIAVIGDTKPIKDKLKELGGKFNFRLTCGAGWIFRKVDLERIKEALMPKEVAHV